MVRAQCAGCQHGISQSFLCRLQGRDRYLGRAGFVARKEFMYLLAFEKESLKGRMEFFLHNQQAQKTNQELWRVISNIKKKILAFLTVSTWTHLDFGGVEADIAVHSMESDGVELALV